MPQQAVAERPSCLYQRPPGLGPDDAIGRQPALTLEAADSRDGLRPEVAIGFHSLTKHASETLLDVQDGGSGVTRADESDHVRRSLGGAALPTLAESQKTDIPQKWSEERRCRAPSDVRR